MSFFFGKKGLRLSQSLGAFRKPDGDISPLYVFFEVENKGSEEVEVASLQIVPKGEDAAVAGDEIEGKGLPFDLAPGASERFQVRAKALASSLKDAGYSGTPKIKFVVEDGRGNEHSKTFKLRVDEYLALKDE